MPFGWRVSAEDGWIVFLLVYPPPCQSMCVSGKKKENGEREKREEWKTRESEGERERSGGGKEREGKREEKGRKKG